jgi:hypothetical protein
MQFDKRFKQDLNSDYFEGPIRVYLCTGKKCYYLCCMVNILHSTHRNYHIRPTIRWSVWTAICLTIILFKM